MQLHKTYFLISKKEIRQNKKQTLKANFVLILIDFINIIQTNK
jgi:hypothetical protein